MSKSKIVYLDYASATPIDSAVFSIISNNMKENFANSSAIHEMGMRAKKKLEKTRGEIANFLNALPDEIIFTSGATESNNLAIMGVLEKYSSYPHIVTTNIEHSSVLEVCKYLEKTKKAEVTYVAVEENGIIDPRKIKEALKPNTVLISVMYANNEIGTIQPIREIIKEVRHYRKQKKDLSVFPIFHTDATQAVNYLPMNILKLGVDLMSFNSAKIYGPKGVGVLFKKRNILLNSVSKGGDQEFGLRPGTENVAGIAGLAEALRITEKIKEKESKRLLELKNYFIDKLIHSIIFENYRIVVNGDLENRLPNNINITIPKIPSDLLVIELSARGIYVSEKSACKTNDKKGSYVIEAIKGEQTGSLRFSLGRQTSKTDIDYTLKALSEILKKLKKWYD